MKPTVNPPHIFARIESITESISDFEMLCRNVQTLTLYLHIFVHLFQMIYVEMNFAGMSSIYCSY